ncbi:hypothetical protein [Kordia sp.]|uniref:hypothetical protein n=1 Tax=Kordia sp. TaxID=1965332 RepID=UPI003D6C40BA
MKKRSLKTLGLNKKSISSLNVMGGAVGASSHPSARTACMSCTRSCDPKCPITLADEDGCKADGQQQQQG